MEGTNWVSKEVQKEFNHGDSVWAIEQMSAKVNKNLGMKCDWFVGDAMYANCFLTASEDCTVRAWTLHSDGDSCYVSPIGIYYGNPSQTGSLSSCFTRSDFEAPVIVSTPSRSANCRPCPQKGSSSGIRAIRVSPCGRHLAAADRKGSIKILDLHLEKVVCELTNAHESEILALDYIQSAKGTIPFPNNYLFCPSTAVDTVMLLLTRSPRTSV
ncbi:hypothetical protein Ciccas_013390 [Cichlidogyrus casuarinus]|uniref:Uncharacterized protein n=1 Tax=Cichlidogyrus casuarinus TaxID=1844966 RepID=A0ABD2PKR7_9PLAT